MSERKVTKAVIAAAGFGTRFLPQTKAMPKEMLSLIDKPIIQYIVEELVEAGIQDIVIVTGYHKRSIEDHFDDISEDLRQNLLQGGKADILKTVQEISNLANFAYIRQKGPYGNATPILNAAHLIGDEPFIYTFADDFVVAKPSRFKQMIAAYEQTGGSIFACIKVRKDEDYSRYGIVAGEPTEERGLLKMTSIIEKPGKDKAPSDLASVSGYILDPGLFAYLQRAKQHLVPGEEFIQQPSIQQMIDDGHAAYALEIQDGTYYDTGNKLEYLKTVFDFALQHDELAAELESYLREKLL